MHYSFVSRDFTTNRELFLPKRVHLATLDAPKPLHCVIMHGWHSLYAPLNRVENALRSGPNGDAVRFWQVTYDTHWKTFGQSAREIAVSLRKQGVEPKNTLLVGYSMGGVVARAMIAQGFDAAGALCLCSPHFGPAPWMPSGDLGSLSIAPWGDKLARLNRHPRDIARRGDYFFQAFTFRDRSGWQHHDRIVTERSALASGLEGSITRQSTELHYPNLAPGCDPHLHGMAPEFLPEARAWCASRFAAMREVSAAATP